MNLKKLLPLLFIFGCINPLQTATKDFPITLQEIPAQCGPASVKMICDYYGKDVSLDTLETMTGMDEVEGTSLLGLSNAMKELGFRTLAAKCSYQELEESVPLPAILHWEGNSFVVVFNVHRGRIDIADPAKGISTYPKHQFLENWLVEDSDEGIVMMMEEVR